MSISSPATKNSSGGTYTRRTRSHLQQKKKIEKECEPVLENVVDILKKKSSIAGLKDHLKKLDFSSLIQKAYIDIQDAFNGRTKVIMEIVASVPNLKIIFLPNEDNIHKYEQDKGSDNILDGVTYAKSETIIVAAKGYDKQGTNSYRKFLGVIIHEFCHFAVHETFGNMGNMFKPYYAHDSVNAEKCKKLVDHIHLNCPNEYSLIKDLFHNYTEDKWIDELIVRYPQFYVEHHGEVDCLEEFQEIFEELHSFFKYSVLKEFKSEKENIASLRSVNDKSLSGDSKSKLDADILIKQPFKLNCNAHRQVLKTNQTYLIMKNIYKEFYVKSKSTFMIVNIYFLKDEENFKLLEKALQCKKITNLFIDGHDDAYNDQDVKEKILNLFNSVHVGNITIILHESQNFSANVDFVEHEAIKCSASHLNNEFKGSLRTNFQGLNLELGSLVDIDKFDYSFDELFAEKIYDSFTHKTLSIGNQHKFEILSYLRGMYQHKVFDVCENLDLNHDDTVRDIFNSNAIVTVECLSSFGLASELTRMCGRLKKVYIDHWIVFTELFSHDLSELLKVDTVFLKYITEKLLKFKSLEEKVFHHFFVTGKVIFLFEIIEEKDTDGRKPFEYFANILKSSKNKICAFTRSIDSELMTKGKIIKLAFVTFKEPESDDISKNKEICKRNQDKFSSAGEFMNEMFHFGQILFTNDKNFEKKFLLNNEAFENLKLKKYEKSAEILKKAIEIESSFEFITPQNILSMNLWGHALFHQKKYPEAFEKFHDQFKNEDMLDITIASLLNRAICLYKLKKHKESIKMIEKVIDSRSNSKYAKEQQAKAYSLRGFILSEEKNHLEALVNFHKANSLIEGDKKLDEKNFYRVNLAYSHFALKEYDKSFKLLREVLKKEKKSKTSKLLRIRALHLLGDIFKNKKKYSVAIEKFKNAAAICTNEIFDKKKIYINNQADCHRFLKDFEQSIVLIETALEIESNTDTAITQNTLSMNLWGNVLEDQKNFLLAIEKYENAVNICTDKMNDKKKFYLNNQANCHHNLKEYDQTIVLIQAALNIELNTDTAIVENARSMNLWGLVLQDQKKYLLAIEKYENAVKFCTDEMKDEKKNYLNNQADCNHDLKNHDKVIELVNEAWKIESGTDIAITQNARSIYLWGFVLEDMKRYSAAIEKYEVAVKICTDEMKDEKKHYLYDQADCHRKLGNFDQAIELIKAAMEIKSESETAIFENARSMNIWGLVFTDQKNFTAAIEKFESAVNICTDDMKDKKKRYLNNLAHCHIDLKNYDQAFKLIEAALKIESDTDIATSENVRSMNTWGSVLDFQMNYSAAIEKFEYAAKFCADENNDKKLYLNNQAECHRKLGNCDQTIELIETALKIKADTETLNAENARSMNIWGLVLEFQKNYSVSNEKFENAVNFSTDDMKDEKKLYLNNQAVCQRNLKNYDQAIELIKAALNIKSDTDTAVTQNVKSLNLWGIVLEDQNNYLAAIEKYESAVKICTDEMEDKKKTCLNDLVDCHYYLENYDQAIKLIEAALNVKSDTIAAIIQNARSMNLWGLILKYQKNYPAAIEKYESAVNICTDDMKDEKKLCINNQADCYHILKNNEQAIVSIEAALNIKSDTDAAITQNARSMNLWGLIMKTQKNYSVAIEKFENAVNICKDEMKVKKKNYLNNQADSHRMLKNNEQAIESIKAALKIKSNTDAAITENARSMYLWGMVLTNQKNFSTAIEKFENAANICTIKMKDKKKLYLNNQADCHYHLENYDQAIELIKTALEIKSETEFSKTQDDRSSSLLEKIYISYRS